MRVLIADCQSRVRFALRTLLNRQKGLEVVGEAATAGELLEQVRLTQPDLVLLHWRLQETAPDLLQTLQRLCPGLRVIALSARCETRAEALAAGVEAFVWKTEHPEKLLAAIAAGGPAGDRDDVGAPGGQKASGCEVRRPSELDTGRALSAGEIPGEMSSGKVVTHGSARLAPPTSGIP